MSADKIKKTY